MKFMSKKLCKCKGRPEQMAVFLFAIETIQKCFIQTFELDRSKHDTIESK